MTGVQTCALPISRITAVYGGTGLGLSLSQNLCRLMGGEIEVESELGEGSRFTIRLPAKAEGAAPPVDQSLAAMRLARDEDNFISEAEDDGQRHREGYAGLSGHLLDHNQRERLLVIDDDRNFLELAERLLIRENYTPICSDAPQSALQIARTVRPSAIFLDILMPGFDGWDVLAALRADPITADIPVFMISILAERSKALAAGADGIVMKPLDAAKVKAALTALKSTRGRSKAANA